MTIKSFVTVTVREGYLDSLLAALARAVPATREEPGNLRYDVYVSEDHVNTLVIHEEWRDHDAVQAHLQTEHMKLLFDEVKEQLSGPAQPHHVRIVEI